MKPVVVLDDFFPNIYTGFRIAEFSALLARYPDLRVYTTSREFDQVYPQYAERFPALAPRVGRYEPGVLRDAGLAWFMFIHNAVTFVPDLEAAGVPFVFSLNPGGGFGLDNPESDAKLDRVLASPMLRHVIATQTITRSYLLDRGFPAEKVTLIYGGAINPKYVGGEPEPRRYYPEKPVLDVAFIAHKYMPGAPNKGFPEFCALASILADDERIAWHVAGHGFSDEAWPVDLRRPRSLRFHGLLESSTTLWEFTQELDLIVSPQRPFQLYPGNFDSFPTMSAVEASLRGAVMMCSDVLQMNDHYRDGVEIVVVPPQPDLLARKVSSLLDDPAHLVSIARAGQARSRELFSNDRQLGTRFGILDRPRT